MANPTVRNIHININGKDVVNSFSGISKAMRETNRDISNLNRNDADYNAQLKRHNETLAKLRVEYAQTRGEIGRMPSTMKSVSNEVGDLGVNLVKAFSVGAVVGKFAMEFTKAQEISKNFDQAQANLAGVMETTKTGVRGLTEDAKKYGSQTSFTASQVSELQLELAKLGKTEQEIKSMTKGVLDAAVALDAGLGPAAELVGGQLNSFGEDASQAQRYADVLANSANISAASFESQATALPKVSAVANQMNISFEKTNAILGVLADQNIAAETSGTGLRNILLTSAKEGQNYEDMLQRIASSTNATKLATEMFGKENATVAVILANNFDKVESATTRLENSVGSAAALAETRLDSVTGSQTLFNSAWEGMILAFDDGKGPISEVTKGLYGLGSEIIGLITPSNQLSDAISREQVELNSLVAQITSTNVSNVTRNDLINKLKATYPDFIAQIGEENLSNENLRNTLFLVNDQYRKRILLQAQVERTEAAQKNVSSLTLKHSQEQLDLEHRLSQIISERGYKYIVDLNNIKKSAKDVQKLMSDEGTYKGVFSEYKEINTLVKNIDLLTESRSKSERFLKEEQNTLKKVEEATSRMTEVERERLEVKRQIEFSAKKEAAALNASNNSSQTNNLGSSSSTSGKSKKSLTSVFSKGEAEIDKILQESIDRRSVVQLQGFEKEKQQIENKYAVLINKYKDHSKRIIELETARDAEILEAQAKGNSEIDALIKASQDQIELKKLSGIERETAIITAKYAKEIEKYSQHTEKLKELEAQRDIEIQEARLSRLEENRIKREELENQNEIKKKEAEYEKLEEDARSAEERSLILLEKTREIALIEIEIEQEKELAKIEAVEGAELLKAQIREKYALQANKVNSDFTKAEKTLRSQQVDWTTITEDQKLNATKAGLSGAAEAFNEGSGAWKAAKIAETTITTYQSATSAFNSLSGIPIVGPALGAAAAALAVVSGIKNIQKISQTPLNKMPTYFYGGYTGDGKGNFGGDEYGKFTGATHVDEWVSPALMTQSPRYAPIINWLDNERQMMLNGGSSLNANPLIDLSVLQTLAGAVIQLNEVLDNGIVAKNSWGYEDLEKMNSLDRELQVTKQNGIIS